MADKNTERATPPPPAAPPSPRRLLDLCRQLVNAERGVREVVPEMEDDSVSRDHVGVAGCDRHVLEGGLTAELSVLIVILHHPEDSLSPGARGESNPAVHVVVAVLGYVEHLVFCLIPSPFGGGKTADCESLARQGRKKINDWAGDRGEGRERVLHWRRRHVIELTCCRETHQSDQVR